MKLLDWDDAHNLDRDRLIIASKSLFESAALQLRHHHGLYQPWQAVGTFYNGVVGQMIQTLSFGSAESSSSIDGSIVDTIDWLTECMVVTFEYEVKQVRPMKLVESLKKFNQLMNSDEIMAALVSVAIVAGTSAVSADVATTIIAQQGEEMLQDLGANLPEMSSSTSSIESHEESVASDVNSSSSAPPSATTTTTNTTPAPPGKSKEEIKIYQERLSFFKKLQACKYPNRAELAIKFQLDLADRIEEDENE